MQTQKLYQKFGFLNNLAKNGFAFLLGLSWALFELLGISFVHPLFVILIQIVVYRRIVIHVTTHPLFKVVIPSMVFAFGIMIPMVFHLYTETNKCLNQLDKIGPILIDPSWNHAMSIHPLFQTLNELFVLGIITNIVEIILLFAKCWAMICFNFVLFLILSCF
jgi:hypothetical protein